MDRKPGGVAVKWGGLLCPPKYTAGNYGFIESKTGHWLNVNDIINVLEFVEDDHSKIHQRLVQFIDYLRA